MSQSSRRRSALLGAYGVVSCGGSVVDRSAADDHSGTHGATGGTAALAAGKDGGGSSDVPSEGRRGEGGTEPFLLPLADGGIRTLAPPVEVWLGQSDVPITVDPGAPPAKPARLVLVLEDTPQGIVGTVTFGDAPPPAPPTSPDVLWPEGRLENVNFSAWIFAPMEGFEYRLASVRREGERLLIQFAPAQLWSKWCELQPSYKGTYPDGMVAYACVPPDSPESESMPTPHPVKADLCAALNICLCDATSCDANRALLRTIELIPDGSDLVGQTETGYIGIDGTPANIRLRRIQ